VRVFAEESSDGHLGWVLQNKCAQFSVLCARVKQLGENARDELRTRSPALDEVLAALPREVQA
jgi:hypothetical protein